MAAIPWFLTAILWMPLAFAGALGFVPLVGLLGLVSVYFYKEIEFRTYSTILAFCFVYAGISSLWSPYKVPLVEFDFSEGDISVRSAVLRVGLIALFGGLAVLSARHIKSKQALQLMVGLSIAVFLQAVGLIVIAYFPDQVFNTFSSFTDDHRSAVLNLGRNISAFAVGIVLVIAMLRGGVSDSGVGRFVLSAFLGAVAIYYCHKLSATGPAIGILLAWFFMFLPQLFGKFTFRALGIVSAVVIVLSPVLFSLMIMELGDAKENLNISFLSRVEIWNEVLVQMSNTPLFGQGLDFLRVHDAVYDGGVLEGQRIIHLHAHNMPMHIWVETGYIGVFLISLTVLLIGFRIPAPSELGPIASSAACGIWALCLVLCTVSYSVWSDWWWALVALAVGFVAIFRQAWGDEI